MWDFSVDPSRIPASALAPSQPFDRARIIVACTSTSLSLPSSITESLSVAPGPSSSDPALEPVTVCAEPSGNASAPPRQNVEVLATVDEQGSLVLEGADAEDFIRATSAGERVIFSVGETAATSIYCPHDISVAVQATANGSLDNRVCISTSDHENA